MNQIIPAFALLFLLAACNDSTSDKPESDSTPVLSQTNNNYPAMTDTIGYDTDSSSELREKGMNLVAQSDCLTCHKIKEKNIGPSYAEVANKYPSTPENIQYLATKIIKGGAGVWGEVAMTPHPALSNEDATHMVNYILTLKDAK